MVEPFSNAHFGISPLELDSSHRDPWTDVMGINISEYMLTLVLLVFIYTCILYIYEYYGYLL